MITHKPLLAGANSKMQFELCRKLSLSNIEKELARDFLIPQIIIKIICFNIKR